MVVVQLLNFSRIKNKYVAPFAQFMKMNITILLWISIPDTLVICILATKLPNVYYELKMRGDNFPIEHAPTASFAFFGRPVVAQLVPMHTAPTIWRMQVSLESRACLYMSARFGSNTPRSMQSILQCVLSCLKSRLSICEQHQLSPQSQSRRVHPNLLSNQPSFQYSSRAPSVRGMQKDAS